MFGMVTTDMFSAELDNFFKQQIFCTKHKDRTRVEVQIVMTIAVIFVFFS
jgi:hypothetical protein